MDLIFEIVICNVLKEGLETIVNVGLLVISIGDHLLAMLSVDTLETEHSQDHFQVVLFSSCEEIVSIVVEVIWESFEFTIFAEQLELLVGIKMDPISKSFRTRFLIFGHSCLKVIGTISNTEVISTLTPWHIKTTNKTSLSFLSAHHQNCKSSRGFR